MAKAQVKNEPKTDAGKTVYRDSGSGSFVRKDYGFPVNRVLKQGEIPKK